MHDVVSSGLRGGGNNTKHGIANRKPGLNSEECDQTDHREKKKKKAFFYFGRMYAGPVSHAL